MKRFFFPKFTQRWKLLRRKGFTLLELLVVCGVVAVLAAVGVPAVSSYLSTAECLRLEQTAKTVFLSAQSALTQAADSGTLSDVNGAAAKIDLAAITPEVTDEETKENAGKIAYLASPGQGADTLLALLSPYVRDPEVLSHAILLEYNTKTGVVRSVFYSEKSSGLSYTGTGRDNVTDRTAGALKANKQGYYGVDFTGFAAQGGKLDTPEVKLVNGDLLTLDITDVLPSGDVCYDIVFRNAAGESLLTITGLPGTHSTQIPLDSVYMLDHPDQRLTLAAEKADGTAAETQAHAVYQYTDTEGGAHVALILDSVYAHIAETYPELPIGEITAGVTARTDSAVSDEAESNVCHSYFADEADAAGKKTYGLANARHLANMQWAQSADSFTVERDIDWTPDSFEGVAGRTNATQFVSLTFQDNKAYSGSFDGAGFSISDLTIEQSAANAGFFAQMGAGASAKDLELNNITVDAGGGNMAGALAGYAESAAVTNVSVTGEKSSVTGANSVGGLLGRCYLCTLTAPVSEASVTGARYVGGVIGFLEQPDKGGKTSWISISGARSGSDKASSAVSGDYYVGGVVGYSALKGTAEPDPLRAEAASSQGSTATVIHTLSISDCENYSAVTGKRYVGGILGLNEESTRANSLYSGKFISSLWIVSCSNHGAVTGTAAAPGDDGLCFIGGMTGHNYFYGTISSCVNSGSVTNPGKYTGGIAEINEGNIESCTNSGAVTTTNRNGVYGDNVGGIAGRNVRVSGSQDSSGASGKIEGCENTGSVRGRNNVGGIAGVNDGVVTECFLSGLTQDYGDGLLVTGQTSVGGVVGLNNPYNTNFGTDNDIPACVVESCSIRGGVVTAYGGAAGGVIGTNLGKAIDPLAEGGKVSGAASAGGLIGSMGTSDAWRATIDYTGSGLHTVKADVYGIAQKDATSAEPNSIGGVFGCYSANTQNGIENYLFDGSVTILYNYDNQYAGGIVGVLGSAYSIKNCSATGSVVCQSKQENTGAGGIVGRSSAALSGCVMDKALAVASQYNAGGLVGLNANDGGTLDAACKNSYKVSVSAALGNAGGFVGLDKSGGRPFTAGNALVNHADVSGGKNVGGVVGSTNGGVAGCGNAPETVKGKLRGAEITVTRGGSACGGVVGLVRTDTLGGGGAVTGCTNSGSVSGANADGVGGVVGVTYGSVADCANTGGVAMANGGGNIGGVVGKLLNVGAYSGGLTVSGCANSGTVSGGSAENVGGIIGGVPYYDAVSGCVNSGAVSGGAKVGGVAGFGQSCTVSGCTNSGAVSGSASVGGLVGATGKYKAWESVSLLEDSINSGGVTASAGPAGGLLGSDGGGGTLSLSFSLGAVKAASGGGGLVGSRGASAAICCCAFLPDASGAAGSVGNETGLTLLSGDLPTDARARFYDRLLAASDTQAVLSALIASKGSSLSAPAGVVCAPAPGPSCTVSWSPVSGLAAGCRVTAVSGGTTYTVDAAWDETSAALPLQAADAGKTFSVTVTALGISGYSADSPASEAVSFTAQAAAVKLAAPAVTQTEGALTFTWASVENASSYTVCYKLDADTDSTSVSTADLSWTVPDTAAAGSYTLYVVAKGDGTQYLDSDGSAALPFTVS